MNTFTIQHKAKPGDRVAARNYRRGNKWEHGEVLQATAAIYGQHDSGMQPGRVSYRIVLDRKTGSGKSLFLYLGDDSIEKIK